MTSIRLAAPIVLSALLQAACSGSSGNDPSFVLEPPPAAAAWDPLDWDPFDCTALPDTPAAVADTPRARPDIERLALHFSAGIVADSAIYDRLAADLTTIGMLDPAAPTGYRGTHDGRRMLVGAEPDTLTAMASGDYDDWDCLNEHYVLESFEERALHGLLRFKGIYELARLASLYERLPGITHAEPDALIGDGPTVYVTPVDDEWHYVADAASGDCPAGCIDHLLYYFISEPGGAVRYMGQWGSLPNAPEPEWVERYWRNAATRP